MEVPTKMNPLAWLRKQWDDGGNDLVQAMVKVFVEQLMSVERRVVRGGLGERSEGVRRCASSTAAAVIRPGDWASVRSLPWA